MFVFRSTAAGLLLCAGITAFAQQTSQVQLKVDTSNRTLTVSAEERVTAEPEIAILHIGFQTPPSDAKGAYAAGSKDSNQIIGAIKQAGISDSSIRSESQRLEAVDYKAHKFRLVQSWVVRVPPVRVAEILDIAVNAGATESGQVEWTVEDEKVLEDKALDKAATRAKSDAAVLAKGMGVELGKLVYASNRIMASEAVNKFGYANFAGNVNASIIGGGGGGAPSPVAIEPHKVSRMATVYAVYSVQ
jgi:uncharacterized protein